jgi:hypothetical protein
MGRVYTKLLAKPRRNTMIDYTKIDFSKFDATKMFNPDQMIGQIESVTRQATGYITDVKSREIAESIAAASIEFVRAQNAAAQAYVEAVKTAFQPK